MPRLTAALLVLLVVLAGSAPLVAADEDQVIGQPSLELYSPNNRFAPGEDVTLQVFISNDGKLQRSGPSDWVERVTTARATTIELESTGPIDVETGRYAVGSVPEGTTGPIPIRLTIPEGVPPGTYEIPVRVRYTYTRVVTFGGDETKFSDNTYNRVQTIPIEVTKDPRFRVISSGTDALIGDRGTLSVTLENVGQEPAFDSRVTVTSGSDEVIFGTASKRSEGFVGEWRPGERKRVNVSVRLTDEAKVRDYTLNVSVQFEDLDGIAKRSKPLATSLRPLPEQSFGLEGVGSTLRVDEEGTVTGTVVNEGPGPARNPVLVASVANPNFDITEAEYALPDLEAGDRADFEFEIDVADSADPGPRQLRFTVRYRNVDDDQRESDTLEARVDVAERRDRFAVEPVRATLRAGSSGAVVLRVTNRGEEPISDVSAKIFPNDPLSSDDDEGFVTELGPGESAELTFGMSVAGSALAKVYPLSIDLQYENADGETTLSKTYRVPVTVTEQERRELPLLPIGGALVVVVLGIGVWVSRKR